MPLPIPGLPQRPAMPTQPQLPAGPGAGAAATPYLRLVGNNELQAREAAANKALAPNPFIDKLSAHLNTLWDRAVQAKQPIQEQIIEDYRQRQGEYAPHKLAEIRKLAEGQGSEIFMMITNQKCRAAVAAIRDIEVPDQGHEFAVEPTPVPDMDPGVWHGVVEQVVQEAAQVLAEQGVGPTQEIMAQRVKELHDDMQARVEQDGKRKAKRMERKVADQLHEGGWRQAFEEFLEDLGTTKKAIIKGPCLRKRRVLKWQPGEGGQMSPQVAEDFRYEFERRSPLDIFPAPDSRGFQHSYLFDRYFFQIEDLNAMRGLPGVDKAKLDQVIAQYGRSGLHNSLYQDQQRAQIEQSTYAYWQGYATGMETTEFWGNLPGFLLLEWQPDMGGVEPYKTYSVTCMRTGNITWRATLNDTPLGLKPYSGTSWEKVPGSFWGRGPSEILRDIQQMCNAVARTIINNMGLASGPQIAINDSDRFAAGTNTRAIYPWKIWEFGPDDLATSNRPPIEFFQPNSMVEELLRVYDYFARLADQYLGVPEAFGLTNLDGAAGKTASGMSMALGQANKGIKRVVGSVDVDVIEDMLSRQYTYNMLYDPDPAIKGDLRMRARGVQALIEREQVRVRRQEFLMGTNNPVDLRIIGLDGRAAVLRESAMGIDIPLEDLNLDDRSLERLKQMMQAMQGMPPGAGQGGDAQPRATGPDGNPQGAANLF